jgi:hypothetical protein
MTLGKTIGEFMDERAAAATRHWHYPSWWNLLVLLPWAVGIVLCVHDWRVDRSIAQREQTTHGVVTSYVPHNHNRYGYAFAVDGRPYTGWESPKANEIEIGKVVTVYYDPADPSTNALTHFDELSSSRLSLVPVMIVGIVGLTLFVFLRRRRNHATQGEA